MHTIDQRLADAVSDIARRMEQTLFEVKRLIVGQEDFLESVMIALLAQGHLLVEGMPGLAKTLTVNTLARVMHGQFRRIQFTPDLLPADLIGSRVFDPRDATFQTMLGPVFANLLLADEINRAPAKVQSALLEAMQERQVTIAGQTHPLPRPFLVMATQNPIETEGTYPLPEAQLDRFMLHILVRYPSLDEEVLIVMRNTVTRLGTPQKTLSPAEILAFQALVRRVPVAEHVVRYAVRLTRATRPGEPGTPTLVKNWVEWGAGPRASQFLILGAKARAVLNGRFMADMSDIKALAAPVLRHRLVMNYRAEAEGMTAEKVIGELLALVPEQG